MLSRFVPPEEVDGVTSTFSIPYDYKEGHITIFVNGQLVDIENDIDNPLGYIFDYEAGFVTFYIPLELGDILYMIYEKKSTLVSFNNVDWNKKVIAIDFDVKVTKIDFSVKIIKVDWFVPCGQFAELY